MTLLLLLVMALIGGRAAATDALIAHEDDLSDVDDDYRRIVRVRDLCDVVDDDADGPFYRRDLDGLCCRDGSCFQRTLTHGGFLAVFHGYRGAGKSSLLERLGRYEAATLSSASTSASGVKMLGDVLGVDTPGFGLDRRQALPDLDHEWMTLGAVHRLYLVLDPTDSESLGGVGLDLERLRVEYGAAGADPILVVTKCDLVAGRDGVRRGLARALCAQGVGHLRALFVSAVDCVAQLAQDLGEAAHEAPLPLRFRLPDGYALAPFYDALPAPLAHGPLPAPFRSLGQYAWWLDALVAAYDDHVRVRHRNTRYGDGAMSVATGVSMGASVGALCVPPVAVPLLVTSFLVSMGNVGARRALISSASELDPVYERLFELKQLQARLRSLFR